MTTSVTRSGSIAFVLLVAGAGGRGGGAAAAAEPYSSARECAACHQTIHKYWSESEHARAASSPVFRAALADAWNDAADCLNAIAPC